MLNRKVTDMPVEISNIYLYLRQSYRKRQRTNQGIGRFNLPSGHIPRHERIERLIRVSGGNVANDMLQVGVGLDTVSLSSLDE